MSKLLKIKATHLPPQLYVFSSSSLAVSSLMLMLGLSPTGMMATEKSAQLSSRVRNFVRHVLGSLRAVVIADVNSSSVNYFFVVANPE